MGAERPPFVCVAPLAGTQDSRLRDTSGAPRVPVAPGTAPAIFSPPFAPFEFPFHCTCLGEQAGPSGDTAVSPDDQAAASGQRSASWSLSLVTLGWQDPRPPSTSQPLHSLEAPQPPRPVRLEQMDQFTLGRNKLR